jgi:menaquinone-dependent protoporphyrinogen oxidase
VEFLIVFETVEGQTRKIAERVEQQIQAAGHGVRLFNTENRFAQCTFDGCDKVVLAAPVHERRHPASFEDFVASNRDELKVRPTLLISVSLKAAFPEGLEEAQDYLIEMEMRTGFDPDHEVLAAGAIRTASYGYFESQVVHDVVLDGRDVDLVEGMREFTDWDQLGVDVAAFMQATPPDGT